MTGIDHRNLESMIKVLKVAKSTLHLVVVGDSESLAGAQLSGAANVFCGNLDEPNDLTQISRSKNCFGLGWHRFLLVQDYREHKLKSNMKL